MLVAVGVNGASESAQESCLADHGEKPLFVRKRVLFENVLIKNPARKNERELA